MDNMPIRKGYFGGRRVVSFFTHAHLLLIYGLQELHPYGQIAMEYRYVVKAFYKRLTKEYITRMIKRVNLLS